MGRTLRVPQEILASSFKNGLPESDKAHSSLHETIILTSVLLRNLILQDGRKRK